jgi:hypothetical protein
LRNWLEAAQLATVVHLPEVFLLHEDSDRLSPAKAIAKAKATAGPTSG